MAQVEGDPTTGLPETDPKKNPGKNWAAFAAYLLSFREELGQAFLFSLRLTDHTGPVQPLLALLPEFRSDPRPEQLQRAHEAWEQLQAAKGGSWYDHQVRLRLADLQEWTGEATEEWLRMAGEAWKQLKTARRRILVLNLLSRAMGDVFQELLKGEMSQSPKQESLSRALRNARRHMEKAGAQYLAALEVYREATRRALLYSALPPLSSLVGSFNKELEQRRNWYQTVKSGVEQVGAISQRLQQTPEFLPLEKAPRKKPGPHEKKTVNQAIRLLEIIFQDECGLSHNQARAYTHCLLYVASIWPNPDPQGLPAKDAQLRRQSRWGFPL